MGAGKAGNGGKCKRSMRLSKSWGKNPKECMWWNDEIKAPVRRKEAAWEEVLADSDKKKMCGRVQRGEEKS